jgi:hypothetical protein
MGLMPDDLLPGEHLVLDKAANAVISIAEHGLSRFAFDRYMGLVGMKGKEAIGGRLYLTDCRLIFKSHAVNRLTGKFSVFLPTIVDVKDTSGFIAKKMEVATRAQKLEFVVWGIPELMAAIRTQRDLLGPPQRALLRAAVAANYARCGDGLKISRALEAINVGLLTAQKIHDLISLAQNPLELSSALSLFELFSEEG